MIKKIIYLTLFTAPLFIMAKLPEASSSGAPAAHTGAPGEATCSAGGCHDDNAVNIGSAILTIDMGTANYTPGHTYPVKISITDPSVTRFGFQLVALTNANSNAGTFHITDTKRTQIIKNQRKFADREYVTYTFYGTDAVAAGTAEWTMSWTAPSSDTGPITLYAAGVSADDDESDQGDHVYTKQLAVHPL